MQPPWLFFVHDDAAACRTLVRLLVNGDHQVSVATTGKADFDRIPLEGNEVAMVDDWLSDIESTSCGHADEDPDAAVGQGDTWQEATLTTWERESPGRLSIARLIRSLSISTLATSPGHGSHGVLLHHTPGRMVDPANSCYSAFAQMSSHNQSVSD